MCRLIAHFLVSDLARFGVQIDGQMTVLWEHRFYLTLTPFQGTGELVVIQEFPFIYCVHDGVVVVVVDLAHIERSRVVGAWLLLPGALDVDLFVHIVEDSKMLGFFFQPPLFGFFSLLAPG